MFESIVNAATKERQLDEQQSSNDLVIKNKMLEHMMQEHARMQKRMQEMEAALAQERQVRQSLVWENARLQTMVQTSVQSLKPRFVEQQAQHQKQVVLSEQPHQQKRRLWTCEEKERFEEALAKYGNDDAAIAAHIGTRTITQVCSHRQHVQALKNRPPSITTIKENTQPRYWTSDEHKLFLEALEKYGPNQHIAIAKHVGTRTPTQARSHAQKYFLKLQDEQYQRQQQTNASEELAPRLKRKSPSESEEDSTEEEDDDIEMIPPPSKRFYPVCPPSPIAPTSSLFPPSFDIPPPPPSPVHPPYSPTIVV
jgi:SHAQKYF class myb-like DNA-binding protein